MVELAVDQGSIHALFMEISEDYSHFSMLGDFGPTVVSGDPDAEIEVVYMGESL